MSDTCNLFPPFGDPWPFLPVTLSILEWVAVSSSRRSSQPRDWICASCTTGRFYILSHCGSSSLLLRVSQGQNQGVLSGWNRVLFCFVFLTGGSGKRFFFQAYWHCCLNSVPWSWKRPHFLPISWGLLCAPRSFLHSFARRPPPTVGGLLNPPQALNTSDFSSCHISESSQTAISAFKDSCD